MSPLSCWIELNANIVTQIDDLLGEGEEMNRIEYLRQISHSFEYGERIEIKKIRVVEEVGER